MQKERGEERVVSEKEWKEKKYCMFSIFSNNINIKLRVLEMKKREERK